MIVLTIIAAIWGAVGTIGTLYFGFKTARFYKEFRRITWDELQIAARELRSKIEKEFHFDIILAEDRWGAAVANLLLEASENVVVYI